MFNIDISGLEHLSDDDGLGGGSLALSAPILWRTVTTLNLHWLFRAWRMSISDHYLLT